MNPEHLFSRELGGPQRWSGSFGEEKDLLPRREQDISPVVQPAAQSLHRVPTRTPIKRRAATNYTVQIDCCAPTKYILHCLYVIIFLWGGGGGWGNGSIVFTVQNAIKLSIHSSVGIVTGIWTEYRGNLGPFTDDTKKLAVLCFLGNLPASELLLPTFRNLLAVPSS